MNKLDFHKTGVILTCWFIGWVLCGATIAVGKEITSMQNTLIIHAILAPVFFAAISFTYHKKYGYTSPLYTAVIFTSLVILADALLVAPVLEKSYEMFKSFLGTWIVFILILISTYLAGLLANK